MSNAFDVTVNALRENGLNSDQILKELSKLFQKMAETMECLDEKEVVEKKVISLLKKVGVPVHLKGFEYWKEAIIYYKETGNANMEEIYQEVAWNCKTTSSKVERSMRYSAEYAFKKCSKEDIETTFGSKVYMERSKITNKEFLTVLAYQI